jgi:hypothetical protein
MFWSRVILGWKGKRTGSTPLCGRVSARLLSIFALCMLPAAAIGQTYTYTYRFIDPISSGVALQQRYDVEPDVNAQALFSGTSSERWTKLLESGYILGMGTPLTRGQDVSEDFHLNWINPEVEDRNYYDNWWVTGEDLYVLSSLYPRTLANQGPHANASVISNPNLLAMGDDNYLFWDEADGTISIYNYHGGTLETDYTWTHFSGGYWDEESLESKLHLMIGYEESYLYFLEGDSTVVRYLVSGVAGGYSGLSYTVTFEETSDLAGYTLGQLVDGEIDGYTYIGWDVGPVVIGVNAILPIPIPEPATTTLLMLGGMLALMPALRQLRKHKG